MDTKTIAIIAVVVIVVAIIAGYLLLQPGGRQQTQTATTTPTTKTTTTTTTTTTQPRQTTPRNETTTTTTVQRPVSISAEITVWQTERNKTLAKVSLSIKKLIDEKVLIKSISIDNITPSSPRFIDGMYYEFDPPEEIKTGKTFTWDITIQIPQDLVGKWKSGTIHTITIKFIINNKIYEEMIRANVS